MLWVLTFWFSVVVVGVVFLSVLFCCLFWVTQISGLRICGVAKSLVVVGKGEEFEHLNIRVGVGIRSFEVCFFVS